MSTLCVEDPTLRAQLSALGLAFEKAHLSPTPGGDAAWLGFGKLRVGLERKRADDFVRSWASGHLADQLQRMAPHYDVVILLQEGYVGQDDLRGANYDALMNDLQTWQDAGLRYQIAFMGDAGRRVWSLYNYYQKSSHSATQRGRLKAGAPTNLLTTPGLGPKRAEALLRALLGLPGAPAEVERVLGQGRVGKAFWERVEQ